MKTIFAMRQYTHTLMATALLIAGLFYSIGAQAQGNRALSQGDTITVSYTSGGHTYYISRVPGSNSIEAITDYPTENCLWVLSSMTGAPSKVGQENKAVVQAMSLTAHKAGETNKYFYVQTAGYTGQGAMYLTNENGASNIYTIKSRQDYDNYIEANILVKQGNTKYYFNYEWWFHSKYTTKPQTMRIQKWSGVQESVIRPTFLPNSKIFDFAETADAANNQQTDVTCKVNKRVAEYYYNVSNPGQRIVLQEPQELDADPGSVSFAWRIPGETQMSFTEPQYNSTDKVWEFKVKPVGPSPVTTDTVNDKLKDIENYIVCTATFDGKPSTGEMHCIRRKFWKRTPPKLEFSVTHPTYRFAQNGEKLTLTPYLWLQDLTEWINTDGIVEHRVVKPIVYKEEGRTESVDRYRVKYPDIGLTVDIVDNASWIHLLPLEPLGIPMTADVNSGDPERSATILVHVVYKHFQTDDKGNFIVADGKEGLSNDDPNKYVVEYQDEFTRQVTLYQDGQQNSDAQILFTHKNQDDLDAKGQQKVHTNKKILYYVPGDKAGMADGYGSEVELRPAEMAFFAYRRWYNYDNGHGIQNSATANDNTIWADAPHITNGRTSYNYTPINTDNVNSRGVFAIARSGSTSSGFRILYSDMTDAAPIIRGYRNTNGGDGHGVHTIACDLSAFTDYVTEPATGNTITRLTEPTLSYRMLFELHPANEIADKLRDLPGDKYLEEYEYTAPTGVDVHLTTSQRFRNYRYHKSELGYYYWNSGKLVQIQGGASGQTIRWEQKIGSGATTQITNPSYSSNTDNLIVSSRTEQTIVYTLTIGGRRIAKFTVHYKKPTEVGPSAVALLTDQEIEDRYKRLEKIDWDDIPGKSTSNNVIAAKHLDWEDATFGYAYQKENLSSNRPTNKDLCYYGEYLLLNSWNNSNYSWMDKNVVNHSGKGNGFMLFADGTMEPSMVASIRTEAQICSGQQMFCSAWIANACPSGGGTGANPIFRFNVQGRNSNSEEWQDVEIFFAGELPKGSGWRQIKFPVSSHQSYSQTRVCVYNFATTNSGNDFFLDDISLFATPLPLSAYQATTACAGEDLTVVVKVDYNNVDDDLAGTNVYYQGWIEISEGNVIAIPNLAAFNGYYMWDGSIKTGDTQDVGHVRIPAKNFVPNVEDRYPSVQAFIDHLHTLDGRESRAGIFYIKQPDNTYSMYIAHLLQAREGGQYEVRMATEQRDLAAPMCAMSVKLPIYRETKLIFGKDSTDLTTPLVNTCPNIDDEIKVTVTNRIAATTSTDKIETAVGRADWLIGCAFDSVYATNDHCETVYQLSGDALTTARADADAKFLAKYGYTREEVTTAIVYDLRREPGLNMPNPNYNVSDYRLLNKAGFYNENNYKIVTDLCEQGLLELNFGSRTVMLNPGDSLFLWVYPIIGSAELGGKTLAVCNQPQWVDVRAKPISQENTQQIMNLSPIPNDQKTPAQKMEIGSVRISAVSLTAPEGFSFSMPLSNINNAVFGWDSLRVFDTDDEALKPLLDDEKTFHMRYYTDKVYQGTNGVKVYLADGTTPNPDYHSNTKDGAYNATSNTGGWRYYQADGTTRDTIIFRPIDAAYVEYLQDRQAKSSVVDGAGHYSPYSNSDANWITKAVSEKTGPQPGYQQANSTGAVMRSNYTYHLRTNLLTNAFAGELGGKNVDSCTFGVAFFDVIVIPDLLIWRPTVSNEWGDDKNWHGIVNGTEMEWGFAPNHDASVIIPKLDNPLLYPYVTGTNLYPMASGYEPDACKFIYMESGAHILGQEKLRYEKAYVDMPMLTNEWNLISAPLQGMYSGDFYVPHSGTYGSSWTNLEYQVYSTNAQGAVNGIRVPGDIEQSFESREFEGTRGINAPYVTYTQYYNHSVKVHHKDLTDGDATVYTASAKFAPSNALNEEITPGQGVMVLSFGPVDNEPFDIRLPKTEEKYYYYLYGEKQEDFYETTPRGESNRFAYTPNSIDDENMTITLHNDAAGKEFCFGNPTMAYIDLELFIADNDTANTLSGAFRYMYNDEWKAASLKTHGNLFLAPMEAVMLETKTEVTDLTVTIKPSHLTLNNMSYVEEETTTPASAPRRAGAKAATIKQNQELMTITIFNDETQSSIYLAKRAASSLKYQIGEDVEFISSGIDAADEVVTPLNIYTVRDSNAMMIDVRPAFSRIPLGMLIAKDDRTDSVNLCFNTNRYWTSEMYLLDSKTGEETRLSDGLIVRVETPANHEQRYYLMGMDTEEEEHQITTQIDPMTPGVDVVGSALDAPEKHLHDGLLYIRRAGHTYNAQGALLK